MALLEAEAKQTIDPRTGTMEKLRARLPIGAKGRIVIPAEMREAMGLTEGDMLDLMVVDGELRIATMRERIRQVQARARKIIPAGVSLSDELSAERREAAKHE